MKHPKIIAAFAIGCALVLFALIFSDIGKTNTMNDADSTTEVVVAKSPERNAVPISDIDNDGIPDWQNSLVGDDSPFIIESATSSNYMRPDTLTGQLAISLMQDIVENKSYGTFAQNPEAIVEKAQERIIRSTQDELITITDIPVTGASDITAIIAYEAAMDTAYFTYNALPLSTRNEVDILEDAVTTNNPNVLKELDPIIAAYEKTLAASMVIPVPRLLLNEHLNYLNALQAMASSLSGMKEVFSDPLLAVARIKRYPNDVDGLKIAVQNLIEKVTTYKVQ